MRKAWFNKRYIAKLACGWTAVIFSFLGFISTFASFSDVVPESWPIVHRLLLSVGGLAAVWVISFAVCAYWFEKQKWMKVFAADNDHHVYVQYGDVFSENEVGNPKERRNVVIPVNRCFDTIIDNELVNEGTLHGIAFRKLYTSGQYDENTLSDALQYDLSSRQGMIPYSMTSNEKRRGNLNRYNIGSVAEISGPDHCTYFFMALSTLDVNLTPHTTQEQYVMGMQRLIKYCGYRSQGYPVVMPIIDAGFSKTRNDERTVLEYIIKLLKMNKHLISSDIHIVVKNRGKETIPITEL